jgi:hypothetical protein
MSGTNQTGGEGGEERTGFFKRLQGGVFPYVLLAIALAIAAYIIGYGLMNAE